MRGRFLDPLSNRTVKDPPLRLRISLNGRDVKIREEFASSQFPTAVVEAIKKALSNGKLSHRAGKHSQNGLVGYQFEVALDNGKKGEVTALSAGRWKLDNCE